MSTHTDGAASPSVGTGGSGGTGGPGGSDGAPDGADAASADDPDTDPPLPRRPDPPPGPGATGHPPPGRAGHGGDGADDPDSGWVQEEIRRRIAARGVSESGRHSRSDRSGRADRGEPSDRTAPADGAGNGSGPADEPDGPRAVGERTTPRRPRSTRVPDPYSPDGMRDGGPAGDGFTPEQPYRMPGPAATAPESSGTAGPDPAAGTPPKQWPPADGAAGLPRRVPGAGWTLDRRLLGDGAASSTVPAANGTAPAPGDDADPETRMVPTLWTAARADPGPPTADLGRPVTADGDVGDGDLGDGDDDLAPTGLATGDTEVIWRAPGLDEPPAPAPVPLTAPSADAPYTGARPRRFAAATTDAPSADPTADPDAAPSDATPGTAGREPCPALDDAPSKGRKRIVLSERRAVAHSVRTVVDVQDPGPVGTMFRSRLVSTQLYVALRVGGVALIGLALVPAMFAAFPTIGEIAVAGIPVPWILLGFGVYPFLLLLGWWYVGSAERIEQDFVQEVQDR